MPGGPVGAGRQLQRLALWNIKLVEVRVPRSRRLLRPVISSLTVLRYLSERTQYKKKLAAAFRAERKLKTLPSTRCRLQSKSLFCSLTMRQAAQGSWQMMKHTTTAIRVMVTRFSWETEVEEGRSYKKKQKKPKNKILFLSLSLSVSPLASSYYWHWSSYPLGYSISGPLPPKNN